MNAPRLTILIAAVAFVALLLVSRRAAWRYARVVTLLGVSTVMLMPFAWLVCSAFKDKDVLMKYTFLPPAREISADTVNLDNFRTLFAQKETVQGPVYFWQYVLNSVVLATVGTALTLVFSSMGGFALAKYRFTGRAPLMTFMLASMTIPGVVLMAPNFKVIFELGWMDTYLALLVPGAVSVFGIFLYRQAILGGVPDDLIDAGRVDGCSEFRIYLQLAMPLVRPVTGAFCLISFLAAWNSFLAPNVYLQSQDKLPLPPVLNQYIGEYAQHYGVFLAGTLLAIVPPAVLFFALQREFIAGLTSGALKQ